MIFVDTSFLVAFFWDIDPNAGKTLNLWSKFDPEKVASEDILKETLTVLSQRIGRAGAIAAYDKIIEEFVILPVPSERYRAGLKLFLNPKLQKNVSLIDCISAAICHELGIKQILTFDAHFKFIIPAAAAV